MDVIEVGRRVTNFVETNFVRGGVPISPTTSLLDSGLIDSTGILELVSFLEAEFGIVVPDEDVIPAHFETVQAITTFVDAKRRP